MRGEVRGGPRTPLGRAWALGLALATTGCGAGPGAGPEAGGPPAFEARRFFDRNCARCHGNDGRGHPLMRQTMKPGHLDLLDVSSLAREDEELAEMVREGGRGMPAFQSALSPEQVAAMVAHVRKLQEKARVKLATPAATAPYRGEGLAQPGLPPSEAPPELEGGATVEAGRDLFRRACALCHGAAAGGNPRMAAPLGTTPEVLDLRDAASRAAPDEDLARVIREGRGKMPGFGAQYTAEQVRALVAFLKRPDPAPPGDPPPKKEEPR